MKPLIALLLLTASVAAQDTASVYLRMAPASPSSGNGSQFGVGFDIYSSLGNRFAFDGDVSVVKEAKLYVGDGWTFRSQGELLYRVSGPFLIGGGGSFGRHSNSQYVKGQFQPMASVHFRPNMNVDVYATYLFRGTGQNNENNLTSIRGGYRGVWALAEGSKWGAFMQGEFSKFWFDQPGQGRLSSQSFTWGVGVARIREK